MFLTEFTTEALYSPGVRCRQTQHAMHQAEVCGRVANQRPAGRQPKGGSVGLSKNNYARSHS
jgi:hypothetical protein